MLDIMKELEPITDHSVRHEYVEALAKLDVLWNQLPKPKEGNKNSFIIIRKGVAIAIKANNLEKAWEWALKGLPYSGNFNLGGESEFLIAEVAFARGDYENAKKYFLLTYNNSGKRYFKDKNPQFFLLIKDLK